MKLSPKIIEEVVIEVAGEEVLQLVRHMKNKKNISEFSIAENIKLEINPTRNLLYKLYNANLVTYNRKKDKLKGWYIYYWTFNPDRVRFLYTDLKKKKLEKLQERLTREQEGYYFNCENNCIRLEFEKAVEFEYKCPECGTLLNEESNTKKIEGIQKEIETLKKALTIQVVQE